MSTPSLKKGFSTEVKPCFNISEYCRDKWDLNPGEPNPSLLFDRNITASMAVLHQSL
jgi:hypothetical protein